MNHESFHSHESVSISKAEFERLSREWTALDNEYDNAFQAFLDNPAIKTAEEIAKFQQMQKELFELEVKLFGVARGETSIT